MDGRELPRPPRRVPAAAGTLTQLQTTTARAPEPPPRRPWVYGRFLAGFLILLLIVAAGATAGWLVRAQSLRIDTGQTLETVGPAVVRVLATTCGGTGEASGVLTESGRILTATSAVKQSLSIVVVTPDGRILRANPLGNSADGVAVLQPISRFDATGVPLAAGSPDPKAERALIGYTAAGKQTIQSIGSTADPNPLSTVMNTAKLGGPVVDKSAQLTGLVVGDSVETSTIVPVDKLRAYAGTRPTGLTVDNLVGCVESRGPQGAVSPELQVAATPLAVEAQKLLGDYMTLENKREFPALQALYSDNWAKQMTMKRDRRNHQTSYFFAPKLTEVSPVGTGAYARLTFNVLFSPTAAGADGGNCNTLDIRYTLVREGGKLVIDNPVTKEDAVSCDK
jgi:hypothetical protein